MNGASKKSQSSFYEFSEELINLMKKYNLKSITAGNDDFIISSENKGAVKSGVFQYYAKEVKE